MATMKAVQVGRPGGEFELIEREVPEPGPRQVRIKVQACGVCHSDLFVKEGHWPGIAYPRIPGHEVAGRIDKVGGEVTAWKVGERVGVGWHGGHCFECDRCRSGDFINCRQMHITGISSDGGYAEYMVAREEALARIPAALEDVDAAPLLCAGITTFNALRNSGVPGGDRVAIQGIGGLGHLAVQFASKMGFVTVAISGGKDKEELVRRLGATHYLDFRTTEPVAGLNQFGGMHLILATAPSSKAIAPMINALTERGKLLIVAAPPDSLEISPVMLLSGRSIAGWPSGTAKDSEETLDFSAVCGVRPMIEVFPLSQVNEAHARMTSGKVRFRAVLKIGQG
ncbi:MAG TPA: alcohol dehydrogenase [Pirellulales bacterium]|nr:alcohol dehydrogenase [Pirellulales bacterium]